MPGHIEAVASAYSGCGYELIQLQRTSVDERVDIVRRMIPRPDDHRPGVENLLAGLAGAIDGEVLTTLVDRPGIRIERIVSQGQVTPAEQPFVQDRYEWVVLLAGAARILLEGLPEQELLPGDHLLIPAGLRHWVTFTDPAQATVWLAVHFA